MWMTTLVVILRNFELNHLSRVVSARFMITQAHLFRLLGTRDGIGNTAI
jgi:hypothetical protein